MDARGTEGCGRDRGGPPYPVFSEVFILKGFKCCVLEVRILKGLEASFAEVRILKGLEASFAEVQIVKDLVASGE